MPANANNRWVITSNLLHDLLTYGDGSKRVTGLQACWSVGHGFPIVKGVLTWLTMRGLQIERLPWKADWPFSFLHTDIKALGGAIDYLKDHPAEVDLACEELRQIYAHTQNYYGPGTNLNLGRGFKDDDVKTDRFGDYAKTVARHADAASQLQLSTIEVPHDVITSWGKSWRYTGCTVGVQMDIPVEDVLCSYETLDPRPGEVGPHALESGEYLILNRRNDGQMSIPVAAVDTADGYEVAPVKANQAQGVLSKGIPSLRVMAGYEISARENVKALQPLSARIRRAIEVLRAKRV